MLAAAAAPVVVILVTGTVTEMAIHREEVTTIKLPGMLIVMHQPAAIRQIPTIHILAAILQVAAFLPNLPVAAILLAAAARAQPFRPPVRMEAAPANIPGYSFVNALNIK
jgi:hypothetical protein